MYFKVSVKRVLQPYVYTLQLLKHTRSYNTPNMILIIQHKEILQLCNYAHFILGLHVMTICTGRHREYHVYAVLHTHTVQQCTQCTSIRKIILCTCQVTYYVHVCIWQTDVIRNTGEEILVNP